MKFSKFIQFVDPIYTIAFLVGFIEKKLLHAKAKSDKTEDEVVVFKNAINTEFEIAQKSLVLFLGERGDDRLIVIAYNGYIKRTIKSTLGRLNLMGNIVETVKVLTPFTPKMADANGLSFTLEDAVEYTCNELYKKADLVDGEPPPVTLKSEIKPSPATHEKTPEKSVATGFGKVISADRITVQPDGKNPYETFQVVVEDQSGVASIFNGKDLEQKFAQGVFKVGNYIQIERKKSSNFKIEKDGKSASYSKNEFDIRVIK